MTEESDRMLDLLQELAALKTAAPRDNADATSLRKRRSEIGKEMKELAAEKEKAEKP